MVGLIGAFGCGASQAPEVRGATPPEPSFEVPSASANGPLSATADSPPVPDPFADVKPACRGMNLSFDTEESEMDCRFPRTEHDVFPSPAANELETSASVVEKSLRPGGTATVLVTLTNKTTAPMLLYVDLTCDDEPLFPFAVFDATNRRRIDLIAHKNCDTNTFGCTRRVLRLVLEPGGSFRRKRSFIAKVTKIVADCGEIMAGPIPRGTYVLHVVSGLPENPDERRRPWLQTPLVVK